MSNANNLDFSLDRDSEVPLGTQLIWKLRTLISNGTLPPGARLPGLREVAESAGVNINTVRAVFAKLEEQRVLASEQGRGTFVAATARRDAALADAAQAAIARARRAGIDPRELAAALYVSPSGLPPHRTPVAQASQAAPLPPDRTRRRALYEQIGQLERELARLDPLSALEEQPAEAAPRILTVPELQRTRDQLAERLQALRAEREQWRAESEAAGAAAERDQRSTSARRSPRWRNAGVWTGHAAAQVSWTSG